MTRREHLKILVATLLTAGLCPARDLNGDGTVRIACCGDSNSTGAWHGGVAWPEYAAELVPALEGKPTDWRNYAVPGATAAPAQPRPFVGDQVSAGLAAGADAVVIAIGLNDWIFLGHAPSQVVADISAQVGIVQAASRICYVVTLPPVVLPPELGLPVVGPYNDAIRAAFHPATLVDGTTDVTFRTDDLIHVSDDGQHVIAGRVAEAVS